MAESGGPRRRAAGVGRRHVLFLDRQREVAQRRDHGRTLSVRRPQPRPSPARSGPFAFEVLTPTAGAPLDSPLVQSPARSPGRRPARTPAVQYAPDSGRAPAGRRPPGSARLELLLPVPSSRPPAAAGPEPSAQAVADPVAHPHHAPHSRENTNRSRPAKARSSGASRSRQLLVSTPV